MYTVSHQLHLTTNWNLYDNFKGLVTICLPIYLPIYLVFGAPKWGGEFMVGDMAKADGKSNLDLN